MCFVGGFAVCIRYGSVRTESSISSPTAGRRFVSPRSATGPPPMAPTRAELPGARNGARWATSRPVTAARFCRERDWCGFACNCTDSRFARGAGHVVFGFRCFALLIADPTRKIKLEGGPWTRGIRCQMDEGSRPGESSEATWTVPAGVMAAEFFVIGGADPSAGGGEVEAAFRVTPGETLSLLLGVDGVATSVLRSDVALIVASGPRGLMRVRPVSRSNRQT